MNILLSAFACRPNYGSEPGVGWNFATTLAKEHQVIVLTGYRNKDEIERGIAQETHKNNLTFVYYDLPSWLQIRNYESALVHIYFFFWQIGIFFKARNIVKKYHIDVIHHITYGGFRAPSFLALLDKPFLFGPVGGGETFPFLIKKSLPFRFFKTEMIRDWVNRFSVMNPLLHLTLRYSALIACKTNETLKIIPKKYHDKCRVALEIGLKEIEQPHSPALTNHAQGLKLLFAGRLVYWKGIHLGIAAYAKVLEKFPTTQFTIIGNGNDEQWIKQIAHQQQVYDRITWIDRVDQATLFSMYEQYDLLVFPSLRDSSGNVVLEAIAHGLPVLCLDVGGPCQIIDESCGIVVPTHRQTQNSLAAHMGEKIAHLHQHREVLNQLKANTRQRAQDFTLDKVVYNVYEQLHLRLPFEIPLKDK